MKTFKQILIILLLSQSYLTNSVEVTTQPNAQSVINQWFSIDSTFDIKMQKTQIEENNSITKYQLSFISDDLQPVNGVLAIPKNRSEEHTTELHSHHELVCRHLLEKKKTKKPNRK